MLSPVRPALADDAPALARLLEATFTDDPFVDWLLRSDGWRPRALRRYVDIMLHRLAYARGRADVVESRGEVIGGALWAPPFTLSGSFLDQVLLLPAMIDVIGLARLGWVSRELEAIERARPREPRFLLTLIATETNARRRGAGSALLRAGLDEVDRHRLPAVLETSVEKNLDFYAGHGFVVTATRELREGPRQWTMMRHPRATHS